MFGLLLFLLLRMGCLCRIALLIFLGFVLSVWLFLLSIRLSLVDV